MLISVLLLLLQLRGMGGDGNCLFRAVAHQASCILAVTRMLLHLIPRKLPQVYGDQNLHAVCRAAAADYMEAEAAWFSSFVADPEDDQAVQNPNAMAVDNTAPVDPREPTAPFSGQNAGSTPHTSGPSSAAAAAASSLGSASASSTSAAAGRGLPGGPTFAAYLAGIRRDGVWGDDPEVQVR
jgi:hypothetical protein